ncbi:TraG family conjugative transposon ATPase [Rhizosphaericola mali]|uniref:TraG family conjugative transposon ATPase n=2 Tax=Rhizosphaericola mali TaxID=2545455 RepID=A0A5P2G548_9BACT|nr:TraG family conjugative transposon ATPase [Rhizosphaericola mali]
MFIFILASAVLLELKVPKDERRDLKDLFPLYTMEQGCLLSKQGDITLCLELTLPELFTDSTEEYEQLHGIWVKAITLLPKGFVMHKKDMFTKEAVAKVSGEQDFLSLSANSHFKGRTKLRHRSFLMLTMQNPSRKPSGSVSSNLLRKHFIEPAALDSRFLTDFLSHAARFERVLSEGSLIKSRRLTEAEILGTKDKNGLLDSHLNLLPLGSSPLLVDIQFKPDFTIGAKKVVTYSLSDTEDLPYNVASFKRYDKYSTDKTILPTSFVASLGILLDCDHSYEQFIVIGDGPQTLKALDQKRRRMQSLSLSGRENAISADAITDFMNESISKGMPPIKAHFHIQAWTEGNMSLEELDTKVAAAISQAGFRPRREDLSAAQLYWAGLPGNEGEIPGNELFDTFIPQATCLLSMETAYRGDGMDIGTRFCDRNGIPLWLDMYDKPRKTGLTSNMGTLVCGSSGGGKSMTVNHILRSQFVQGGHIVVVDIGGSYKAQCELSKGYYFTYEENNPIKFNPFYLPKGTLLDTEKKESLKSLLAALWKQENEDFTRSEYVALSNAVAGYYNYLTINPHEFACFDSFYEYLASDYLTLLEKQGVHERYFDVHNFLYVLRPYYKGGEFDFLLNAKQNLDLLNNRFIVIELDAIKDHPILFPVVTMVVMELFISKMRKLEGQRKVLCVDEAWAAIAKAGMAAFLKYAFKTIRKFNGIPIVITQELDDLVDSPVIKEAIINNADIKILMDMRKYQNKFDKLQSVLGLSEKGKALLLSVNKENREIFIDLGGQSMKVFKNELSPEEYLAYTTEGKERVQVLEYARKYGSMEAGIKVLTQSPIRADNSHSHKD